MKTQTLIIPGELSTMNKLINADRTHWAVGAKKKKGNTNFVWALCLQQMIKPTTSPPRFHITFYRKNKRTEKDNLLAQTKEILDGIVLAGVIPDDRWDNYTDLSFAYRLDAHNPRIVVEIIEEYNNLVLDKGKIIC